MQRQISQRQIPNDVQLKAGLHPLVQRLYASRGVLDGTQLYTSLADIPKPPQMKGMDAAVLRLEEAVRLQQKIVIVGDFDADGATSTTLAILALQKMGAQNLGFVVPNRFEYGYGLSPEIVDLAMGQQPDLLVTVDNGISSIAGVEAAKQKGVDVIITDHHLPGDEVPDACAIVNPNQTGCEFPSKNLAGVGVIFYVMAGLRAALRRADWFAKQGLPEPNLAEFLDLVALGSVADVVPLDALNRCLIAQGLQRIRLGRTRPGILALLACAKRDPQFISAQDLGFAVGPRLNAAGRMDDMGLGIACLLSNDPDFSRDIAQSLNELNLDRRDIEQGMQEEALASIDAVLAEQGKQADRPDVYCLYQPQWHQGVVGLVASRIKERFHRPVIAFAPAEMGLDESEQATAELKGSGRSIPGVHMRDLLDRIANQNPGLVDRFGGHAMAAGLSLSADRLPAFKQALNECIKDFVTPELLSPAIMTDGELSPDQLNLYTAQVLSDAGPWGQNFPEPVFEGEFNICQQRDLQGKHIKMTVAPVADPSVEIDAIEFNSDMAFWASKPKTVRLVYSVDINRFRGQESLQLMVRYIDQSSASHG